MIVIPVILASALIFASLITLLSIGFTLTHMIAKIPNFAHGTYAGIGIYVSYTFCKIMNFSPYLSFPVAFVVGGIISVIIYLVIINVLSKLGGGLVIMTISTLAIQILLTAFLNIYAFWLRAKYKTYAQAFLLKKYDFKIGGYQGIFPVSIIMCIFISISLHYLLNKTKIGTAMRATSENSALASILGINTHHIQIISWFIIGGIASLAGAMIPMWFLAGPMTGSWLITSIMAGSLLGGLDTIYGAIVGGFTVGLSEILITRWAQTAIGIWIGEYRPMIPMIVLISVLLFEPRGLYGIYDRIKTRSIGSKNMTYREQIINKLTRNKERV